MYGAFANKNLFEERSAEGNFFGRNCEGIS